MNRRTFLTALGASVLTVAAGCSAENEEKIMSKLTDVTRMKSENGTLATRFVDREAGVVLYRYAGFEKGGLTAIPISETDLQ